MWSKRRGTRVVRERIGVETGADGEAKSRWDELMETSQPLVQEPDQIKVIEKK